VEKRKTSLWKRNGKELSSELYLLKKSKILSAGRHRRRSIPARGKEKRENQTSLYYTANGKGCTSIH